VFPGLAISSAEISVYLPQIKYTEAIVSISTLTVIKMHFNNPFKFLVKKGSPYSITNRRVPELIPVLCIQPAGDVSHKPGGRLPLFSARPVVTPATLKRAATSFAACEQKHNGCERFA